MKSDSTQVVEHNFKALDHRFEYWVDDEGVKHPIETVDDIPLGEIVFEPKHPSFIYFSDQEGRHDYHDTESDIRRDTQRYRAVDEPGVIIRPPSKVSWSVIGMIVVGICQILFLGTTYYNTQNSVNTRIEEKLETLAQTQKDMRKNMYTKQEQDLRYENLQLKLEQNHNEVKMLQQENINNRR